MRSRMESLRAAGWVLGCGVALIALALPAAAQESSAQPSPSAKPKTEKPAEYAAEVMVLHATRAKVKPEKPDIDPRIGKLPELEQEPFSGLYDRFELIKRERVPLLKADPKTIELPNGRVLRTALIQALPKDEIRLAASINQPGGKTFLPLLEVKAHPGQTFIVAGQSFRNGILVLVIRVTK